MTSFDEKFLIGWYKSVLDGSWYQSNEVFAQHPNSLGIISYYDDLKITNIVGAAVGETKLAMFYWTLANIYPELRSKLKCVNLLCIVEYKVLQKFGVTKVLQPFVNDLNILHSEGVIVSVDGVEKIYRGSLLLHTGDTPASQLIGGYKQSVAAIRFCRRCNVRLIDWQTLFDHQDHVLRDLEAHNLQVELVLNEDHVTQMRDFWKKTYGINGKSVLSDVVGFDVTKCLPHDVMHILCEGTAEVHLRVYLKFLVKNKVLRVNEPNAKLRSVDFQQFSRDKPAPITTAHLDNGLRQSACQMIVLVIFLPVLVHDSVESFKDKKQEQDIVSELEKRQECFTLLHSILNVCMAYSISESAADYLGRMIQIHHLKFVDLYPSKITPKFHFLIHAVFYIKLFGPLRQQACFRFEALNAYFKGLLSVTRSTKNMPYTASYRCQAHRACHLASAPGQPARRFLTDTPTYSCGISVLVCNLPDRNLFNDFVNVEEQTSCRVMRTSEATVDGVTYHVGTVLLWRLPENDLPDFVKVEEMFVLRGELLLKVTFLSSLEHCPSLNSYRVQVSPRPTGQP